MTQQHVKISTLTISNKKVLWTLLDHGHRLSQNFLFLMCVETIGQIMIFSP